jgi:hypothetical protein
VSPSLLQLAVQGGIGVVSLVVMYLVLRDSTQRLERHLISIRNGLQKVAQLAGRILGRSDVTPLFTPLPPDKRDGKDDDE